MQLQLKVKVAVISSLVELFPPRGTEGGKEKNIFQTAIKRKEAVV